MNTKTNIRLFLFFLSFFAVIGLSSFSSETQTIKLNQGEKIWSGAIKEGHLMPLSGNYKFDFYANNNLNQLQPLLMSNHGLYVWSEEPYQFEIKGSELIIIDPYNKVKTGRFGATLAEVQRYVSKTFFPASGKAPDLLLFSRPQYNTWIELTYNQNQKDILNYAKSIVANQLPTGVIMIDDTWQEDYGLWKFHPGRFPDPKAMMNELHQMGFKVMLWMCPFVSADQLLIYQELKKKKAFLLEKKEPNDSWANVSEPAMIRWWNGVSAELDFTNPEAVNWFNQQLDRLVKDFGVDGFKFDAGDMSFYPPNALSMKLVTPNEHCLLYTQFGLRFPLNEYRACWKMAGQPLAQRLLDKNHTWTDFQQLVPHMITEGLSGYTFSCPDMIGGGAWTSFLDESTIDQDLVVRSAQCHTLMPMMQFSVAPWRILDKEHLDAVKKTVAVRMKFTPVIMELVAQSAKTGEPILKNLEFVFPGQGLESIIDQFMLGDQLLVAPMQKPGTEREVILPKGKWLADDGKVYKGGKQYKINVPLDRLPYFELMKN